MGHVSDTPVSALATLDDQELARGVRRLSGGAKFLRSHAAVRAVLGAYLGVAPAELRYEGSDCQHCQQRHGRPVLSQLRQQSRCMSMSHSGDLWLLAVADGMHLGVDLESDHRDFAKHATMSFTPEEQRVITGWTDCPASVDQSALAGWTAKEAASKALGVGLTVDFRTLHWTPLPGGGFRVDTADGRHVRGIGGAFPHPRVQPGFAEAEGFRWAAAWMADSAPTERPVHESYSIPQGLHQGAGIRPRPRWCARPAHCNELWAGTTTIGP
ncbi:4'-phosphopantetheinyl transferase superfamily protein [Kocuria soli]|uniref:4'-phosphopantetheinyl transferase superfamily protein n=2 Tax=Kocuria soli TaxID=2485125 RepID=A0A3N4ADR7_9MICC|nr:4'-phosphopantetheinyl transferase superfamily protein [Kocuria soli]